MIIRKPLLTDASILAKYNRDAAVEAGNPALDLEKSENGVVAVIQYPQKGFYLVGEIDGKIASMILITFEWSDWRNANWYMVASVYTHTDFRRQGYFTKLLEAVEKIAKDDPLCCGLKLTVRADNISAKKAYEKLGFHYYLREVWTKLL